MFYGDGNAFKPFVKSQGYTLNVNVNKKNKKLHRAPFMIIVAIPINFS